MLAIFKDTLVKPKLPYQSTTDKLTESFLNPRQTHSCLQRSSLLLKLKAFRNHSSDGTLEEGGTLNAGCQSEFVYIFLGPTMLSTQQTEELSNFPMNSHSKEGSAKMSCVVKQSPTQNESRCIYGDESLESLQKETQHYAQHAALSQKRLPLGRTSILTHSLTHT